MKKYALLCGEKGRYDRPIELELHGIFDTLKSASEELMKYVYVDEKMNLAIKEKLKTIEINYDTYHLDYIDGYLVYYSNGCDSLNEYEGETYKIIEIEIKGNQ